MLRLARSTSIILTQAFSTQQLSDELQQRASTCLDVVQAQLSNLEAITSALKRLLMYCLSTSESGDGLLNGDTLDSIQATPLCKMLNPATQPLLWLPQVRGHTCVAKRSIKHLPFVALHPQHRQSAIRDDWLAPGKTMFPGDIPTRYALDVFLMYSYAVEQRREHIKMQERERAERAQHAISNAHKRRQMQSSSGVKAPKVNRRQLKASRMLKKNKKATKKPKRGRRHT